MPGSGASVWEPHCNALINQLVQMCLVISLVFPPPEGNETT